VRHVMHAWKRASARNTAKYRLLCAVERCAKLVICRQRMQRLLGVWFGVAMRERCLRRMLGRARAMRTKSMLAQHVYAWHQNFVLPAVENHPYIPSFFRKWPHLSLVSFLTNCPDNASFAATAHLEKIEAGELLLWQRRRRRASKQTQAAAATLLKSAICAFHAAAIEGATARVEAERNGHRKRLGRAFSLFRLATLEVQPRGRAAMRRTKLGWQGVRSRLANSIDDLLRRRVILYLFSLSFPNSLESTCKSTAGRPCCKLIA